MNNAGQPRENNQSMLDGLLHVAQAPVMNSFAKNAVKIIDEIDEAIDKTIKKVKIGR